VTARPPSTLFGSHVSGVVCVSAEKEMPDPSKFSIPDSVNSLVVVPRTTGVVADMECSHPIGHVFPSGKSPCDVRSLNALKTLIRIAHQVAVALFAVLTCPSPTRAKLGANQRPVLGDVIPESLLNGATVRAPAYCDIALRDQTAIVGFAIASRSRGAFTASRCAERTGRVGLQFFNVKRVAVTLPTCVMRSAPAAVARWFVATVNAAYAGPLTAPILWNVDPELPCIPASVMGRAETTGMSGGVTVENSTLRLHVDLLRRWAIAPAVTAARGFAMPNFTRQRIQELGL
jgi:hypothetical protein